MRALVIIVIAALAAPVSASDDHDAARAALDARDVRPLADILRSVEAQLGARMIEAELEHEGTGYYYDLEMITGTGRMIEVVVDAATGEIVAVEQDGRQEEND